MEEITYENPSVAEGIAAIRTGSPFVYGLTNYVAANLSANVLLAVGAGPAIGAAADFPTVFPAGAGAVWINTAALISNPAEPVTAAARTAHAAGTRWVLDPVAVGAGAVEYDAFVASLLAYRPTVIRGNASELTALAGGDSTGKGVETTLSSEDAIGVVEDLARRTGAIVAVSGPTDYLTDGTRTVAVPGGDVRLTQVTGAGCSLGALIAGALAVVPDALTATAVAHAAYAVAAERAGARTTGTGSFAVALLDELSLLAV
ncbi:hydroxyethylthiazole kinase [Streptomyces sp. NPDC013161]|uniref:hydroxyethylthiazole kinase n=1 Tax=Streptomyces sp. NPDC013161 TaxID=3364862 RepID=UPI00368C8DDF